MPSYQLWLVLILAYAIWSDQDRHGCAQQVIASKDMEIPTYTAGQIKAAFSLANLVLAYNAMMNDYKRLGTKCSP